MSHTRILIGVAMLWASATGLHAQATSQLTTTTVRGRVEVIGAEGKGKTRHGAIPGTVVWLTPMTGAGGEATTAMPSPPATLRLVQKNKSFEPHILVVPVGSMVEFPNHDPFFHNVFSLFEGKRFDLGLYEAGTSRIVHFDRAGVSYIFCNIHPEMSAVVIALTTPYFGVSDSNGKIRIANVPAGRYSAQVWAEGVSAENLKIVSRDFTISGSEQSLGVFRVVEDSLPAAHKNKYGRDYDATGSEYPPKEPK